MVVYLDTSSLVKLYVKETESDDVERLIKHSEAVATSIVAYAEARAAFARRYIEKSFRPNQYKRLVTSFNKEWSNYLIVSATQDLVYRAGDLAEKYNLRGFDSIHLSSAVLLRDESKLPVVFSCADKKLQKASRHEMLDQPA